MRGVLVISAVILATAGAGASWSDNPRARLAAAATVVRDVQAAIPAQFWNKARCVAVFPEVMNTEFVVGGKYGKGAMSCRTGDRWSAPAFMKLGKGDRMSQMGAQQLDIVLLLMNEGAVQTLLQQRVTLGADASLAPGPIDTQARVDATTLRADILTYSPAKGLYMNIAGGVLRPDRDENEDVYGKGASLRTILTSSGLPAPIEAQGLLYALSSQPAALFDVVQPRVPRLVGPSARPRTVTDDLRARLIEMQRHLARILAEPGPVPDTTSSTTTLAQPTVTIDRVRLMQLQQQLDIMLAALEGR
jgi:SH3 domain-containing YSC84-like protein 1